MSTPPPPPGSPDWSNDPSSPNQPPPGYTPFGGVPQHQQPARTSGMAIASLVLGIVGILLCFIFIPWILAIIFGAIGIRQTSEDPQLGGRGLAIAGLVCGLVAGALVILLLAFGDWTWDVNLSSVLAALRSSR